MELALANSFSLFSIAQTEPFEATIYYKTAQYILEKEEQPVLQTIISYSQGEKEIFLIYEILSVEAFVERLRSREGEKND